MAYIKTEEVAQIRKELKEAFGKKWRFGVRRESGGLSVAVTIKQGTESFAEQFNKSYGKGCGNE